jgi:hypothetical protein
MASHATSDGRYETLNIERSDAKVAGPLFGPFSRLELTKAGGHTHQRPRNMDPTNPPPAKPFCAGSDEYVLALGILSSSTSKTP